jgi:hypothetical protein
MSDVEKLIEILTKAKLHFYHFSDTRNLPSIDERRLLSRRALWEANIAARTGGNDWSLDADRRSGMDAYVHLCFFSEHPMEWLARQDGRIENSRFLQIDPAILRAPGVLITDGVANKATANPQPAEQMVGKLDLKVIYTRTDWKDPQIQERLKAARLCEILIPKHVPRALIKNL